MKAQRRSRFQIYYDILRFLYEESKSSGNPSPTKIAHTANLPYDRFQSYLNHLIQLGMVSQEGDKLAVTKKGLECVKEFEKINDFLGRMGLSP